MFRELAHFARHAPATLRLKRRLDQGALYDHLCARQDGLGLATWRAALCGDLRGRVVEIGAGTGLMFAHYPADAAVTAVEPDGLPAARAAVLGVLDALARDFGRTDARTVLGGFSQGAMLTVDVALHAPGKLAGLALMSGTLIAESIWRPRAAALAGTTIFQSHGTKDALLAFSGAERLRDFLLAAGAEVGFMPFPGGHELPPPVLAGLGDLLARALPA